jgi:hypothetical protein
MKTMVATLLFAGLTAPAPTVDEALDQVIAASYSCGFADGMEHAIDVMKGAAPHSYRQNSCAIAREATKKWGLDLPGAP